MKSILIFIVKIVGGIATAAVTLLVGCALLMGSGSDTLETTGAELAEKAEWTFAGCSRLEEREVKLCKLAITARRNDQAIEALEGLSDWANSIDLGGAEK